MGKRVKLPGRVESAEMGGIVTGAGEILDDLKGKTQEVINTETDAELLRLNQTKQVNLTFDQTPTESSTNPVTSGGVYAADQLLSQAIEAILLLIPSAASALNKLVDMNTMNSSISTATASFKGTYNIVSDLHLGVDAAHAQIEAALDAMSLNADNNDYAFVQVPNTNQAPTEIKKTERYKFNGTNWAYEYDLNNSGFTAAQWAAINSNITAVLVSKLSALPTNEALTALLAGKQANLTFDDSPMSGSNNPVKSGGIYTRNNEIIAMITALDAAKQDVLTFDTTPTENSTNPVTSNGVYQAINLVQAALAALDGRMLTAEHSIEVLTEDVGVLRTLYQALSQSDIIVGTLPATGVANTVYRVPGTSTYADWMYYDGAWVKMAEYTTLDGYLYKGIATPSSSPAASADKMFYFALTAGTYTNFGNLIVTEGISILKYDGANWSQDKISYMDGGVFDVTAYSGSSFASLDALLSDANLNNLIPSAVRKGGMSIKFVHTPDNKYIQARCMANEFTTDTTQWAIAEEAVYVENPEYLAVWCDGEDNIVIAVEKDGNIRFGAGVPQQIIDYVESRIADLSLGEVLTFLGNLINGDKTLAELLDGKVDEEEGKSLIDENIADGLQYIENPEYLYVELDGEYNIVSYRKKGDGKKVECAGLEVTDLNAENIFAENLSLSLEGIHALRNQIKGENLIIVDCNGNGDYTTIEGALANAGDTSTKHVTIVVMPGTYYPAPKYPGHIPYEQQYRNLSLIGTNRDACILKNDVGYYNWRENIDFSVLRLKGNVLIKNFTIISTMDRYIEVATEMGWDLTEQYATAYCCHVDFNARPGDVTAIENCKLYNNHACCVGYGLRPNVIIRIKDCEIESDVNSDRNQYSGFSSYGPVFGHLQANATVGQNQNLEILNCIIRNRNYPYGIVQMDGSGATDYSGISSTLKFMFNVIKTSNQSMAFSNISIPDNPQVCALDDMNYGNNIASMNTL